MKRKRIYEVKRGYFGDRGWKRIGFWYWLILRFDYVTRVRKITMPRSV